MEEERLGSSWCRLRDVVQFVSFNRCDCSGCLICLGLFHTILLSLRSFTFFVKLKLVFNLFEVPGSF